MKTNKFEKLSFSMTYSCVTPESAEDGEFSEGGFIWEDATCTFRELVDYIENDGFTKWSNSDSTGWLSTDYYISDYHTGEERQESLHADNARSLRYLEKAYNMAFIKRERNT
jgi:hypothetical protein